MFVSRKCSSKTAVHADTQFQDTHQMIDSSLTSLYDKQNNNNME